ncbi:MAG TPA: Na/Pi symporter [Gemmatimonadota bacterium]|nr:Na/Pi symporter [Gemmatimonadota bacterium]
MPKKPDGPVVAQRPASMHPLLRTAVVLGLLFMFLLGVNGLGDAFKALGSDALEAFFSATSNPFIGLMVGVLATTLVQSSSVSTSLIVGLVAAPVHPLPLANAIPMIMGANIGTTVTNTIVSLGHIRRPEEFRRAFAVATCHDFFNFIAVAVLLPIELATGYLRTSATALTGLLVGFSGVEYDSPLKGALKAILTPIKDGLAAVATERVAGILLILISGALIYAALTMLVGVMRSAVQTRVESIVARGLEKSALIGIVVGIVVTVMVQSSSITTSLLVPLAGAGLLNVAQAFPVTVGANIGTTVTAMLAALAATGVNARLGLTIALVHLLFNLSATLLVFPFERIRNIPIRAAERLAEIAGKSRRWALVYVILLFYGVPALFALLNQIL